MNQPDSHANGAGPSGQPAARCPFSRVVSAPVGSLADTLKERTKEAHARAERHPLQAKMVKGEVSVAEYAAWLWQMLPVWRALDTGLATLAGRDSRIASMIQPYHPHADRIAADLKFLGERGGSAVALPATTRFVESIQRALANGGPAVVGVWYVLEGSANGGRYIAKALSRGLNISGPEGLTSFDPHGERQREYWQAWRAALDGQPFSDEERDAIVAAASKTFDAVYDVMENMTTSGKPTEVAPASAHMGG